jgi:predicted transcriptional regulator
MKNPKLKTLIALRLKPATIVALQKIADDTDETFSSVVRRILENYVSRR